MRRRTFLGGAGVAATTGLSGCLGAVGLGGGNPDVTLSEPDREYDSADLPYPAWGERVPDVRVSAALADGPVAVRELQTASFVTFFYSHCRTVCPVLVAALRNLQARAAQSGYGDRVTFLPTTFDPARDDAERLRAYAAEMNVDLSAGNWEFLRPASRDRAETVVTDAFGVTFERTEPENMDQYMFAHAALTLLVNADGYVERAYRTKSPAEDELAADLETVIGV
ncbi:SCO family protein [Halobaculum sp. MBLA0143]|uniref:SCO family protein n=1 Tax=Halobaculum sp. MBLA0143 TaxID=3079933 RepID=UPI0035250083